MKGTLPPVHRAYVSAVRWNGRESVGEYITAKATPRPVDSVSNLRVLALKVFLVFRQGLRVR